MNSRNIFNQEQNKAKASFEKLKNNFILKKIFNYMKKKKTLMIMKYNKKLQKRLNLNIEDYKEFSQQYSSIEIEIKLVDNKYGKFINIPDEQEEYYHIYFDNSKEEIKRNVTIVNEKVKTIRIKIDYQVKSLNKLFYSCEYINSIIFKKFNRINVTDISYIFSGCILLKELNLSNINTDNVIYIYDMFKGCSSLLSLDCQSELIKKEYEILFK